MSTLKICSNIPQTLISNYAVDGGPYTVHLPKCMGQAFEYMYYVFEIDL